MGEDTSASSRSIVEEISPALFETIPEALVIVDSSGRIVAVNSGAEQLLGYDRGELVGQPVETLVPNSFREGHPAHRMRYAAQATTRRMGEVMGLQAARKDGSLVAVDITLSTIPSSSGSLIVCAVRDATERAAITQALQASESRFRTLAEQATDGIFISDTSGRYLAVNDAGCTMLGYRRDQLLRLSITDLIDERESDRLPEEIARLAGGTPVKSEWRFRRCDGTTFEGEVNARKLPDSRFLAVLRDVTERKQQEDEQRRTRRFIEAVAKASPSWIYVFDLDDLSLRYLNRSILRDLGYPPEAEGLTRLADFRSFIPSEDNERLTQLVEAWHALGDDDVRSSEYRIRDASGAIRWCLGRETVFARHPDGRVHQILGTMTEVTPLKLAIERLQESEERFRTLIQDLDVGVLLQDAADDRILLSNQAADEMLGMTPELDRPSSHTWPWRLLREDGTDYPRDQLPSVVAARTGQPVWNRIVGSFNVESGICRWLQVTAMPRHQTPDRVRHVLVTLTDVTARKVAEDALIAARMEWEHSFNALTDWVCVLDGEGRVLRANRAMRERFETRPGSLVGMHHRAVYQGEASVSGEDLCASVLAGGPPVEFTTTLAQVPGYFVISCYPLTGTGGAVHVVRDITKQRLLEEQLRQSQKMQAIGQLAGGVAHDFNNLLTVISSCTQLALIELPPEAGSVREDIAAIRAAADRAALLTRQLLLFGRKAVWEERVVNLNELLQQAGQMLKRLIGEDVVVAMTLAPSLWATRGDPAQLEQIVLNLALNARDAMPNGGRLTIETRNVAFTERDCANDPARRPGRFVQMALRDTGTGISSDVRAHLFEPFFTTKGPGKGTGLGLSTVYGIVQQAGGFISVDSAVDVGTTFNVFLPPVTDHVVEAQAKTEARHGATGTETVLVVEDEHALREVMVRSLRYHGFRVLDAASASEALALVERDLDRTIDIVVTDVVMPEIGGQELAQRARTLRPDLPVLFISGYNPEHFSRNRPLAPGDQLLQKPFTPQALTNKIREMVDARRTT
jgi:PAS domain S-box-containing protein